jgi:hypothetical protein
MPCSHDTGDRQVRGNDDGANAVVKEEHGVAREGECPDVITEFAWARSFPADLRHEPAAGVKHHGLSLGIKDPEPSLAVLHDVEGAPPE